MKYLLLIYGDEGGWEAMPEAEREATYAAYREFSERAGAAGKLLGGAELASSSTATTVRVRNDETVVSDGPFAETKEVLGGYFLLEADSIEEAAEWASEIPAARSGGSVEVRPVYEDPEEVAS